MKIRLPHLTCLHPKCGYTWTPRQTDVRRCPKCSSANWDKPRKEA